MRNIKLQLLMKSISSMQESFHCEPTNLGIIFSLPHTSWYSLLENLTWALNSELRVCSLCDMRSFTKSSALQKWHLQNGFCSFYLAELRKVNDTLFIRCLIHCRTQNTHSDYLLSSPRFVLNIIFYSLSSIYFFKCWHPTCI